MKNKREKAVVLFSGGLDSTTALCWALKEGYDCSAVTVSYGQRHLKETNSARKIAKLLGVRFIECEINLPWLNVSSLIDRNKKLPDIKINNAGSGRIPSTYVPGRNLIFTAIGVSYADSVSAQAVVLGSNAVDYSGYPDCRPEFYRTLEKSVHTGTKAGSNGRKIRLLTPLVYLSKTRIIQLALRLKAPLKWTWSCYNGGEKPCGRCDSCRFRTKGFREAGIQDPAL